MSTHIWRRGAAALTAAAVTLLGGALTTGSAHADGGSAPTLFARTPEALAVPDNGDGQVSWGLDGNGTALDDVHVTVDITGISSFATTSDDYCVSGLCTFDIGDVSGNSTGGIVDIKAKPDAKLGTSGTAVISGTVSGQALAPFTVEVSVGQVDLIVGGLKNNADAEPGSTLTAPLTVANIGSLTAATTDYRFALSRGLSLATHFPNCDEGTKPVYSWQQTVVTCHFTTPLEPGKKYKLSTPLKLVVAQYAYREIFEYQPTATSTAVPATPRTSGAADLSLVPDGTVPTGTTGAQQGQLYINTANTADIAVTGDTVTAKPGATARLTATVRNFGPASIDSSTFDDALSLFVDIPKGTTATKVPDGCTPSVGGFGEPKPGAPQYRCDVESPFAGGRTQKLTFTVKIGAGAPATTSGAVVANLADGGALPYDTHKANNTAAFTVHVPGGAATAGSGGTAGSGSTGGNQASTRTGTQGSTQGGAGTAGTTGGSGSLAATGSHGTLTVAYTGAAALALGGAAFAFARRRKARARA